CSAVAGNFVVLDMLCRCNEPCIQDIGFGVFLQQFIGLCNESFHALAVLSCRFLVQVFEDLLETCYLLARDGEVLVERRSQLFVRHLLPQLWQRLCDLLFRAVQIAETFEIKSLQRIQFHESCSLLSGGTRAMRRGCVQPPCPTSSGSSHVAGTLRASRSCLT